MAPQAGLHSLCSWDRHSIDDFIDDHFDCDTMAGRVRPEPDAVPQDILGEVLNVLGIDLSTTPAQQRPNFDETPPADRCSGRRTKVHALLDQLGWGPAEPFGLGIVRTGCADQPANI